MFICMNSISSPKPPQWVSEHLEGLDSLAKEREIAELESQLPGLQKAFRDLISQGQPPYSGSSEFPVAAKIVRVGANGKLETLSSSRNRVNLNSDSTAHADFEVIRDALSAADEKHLPDAWLLSTVEPCAMCSGAAVNASLEGVIYGATHKDMEGRHMLIDGEYKPFRTSPESFSADEYLLDSGLIVVSGFMRDEVLSSMARPHGSWAGYYSDPDS